MKTSLLILASTLLTASLGAAAGAAPSPAPAVQSLRVEQRTLPIFPLHLQELGVRDGRCRVAISVTKDGILDDILPIEYTRREFADATVAAVKEWRFQPALLDGEPIAAATEVEVTFAIQGTVVVSVTPVDSLNARLYTAMFDSVQGYRPRLLSELDRIPTPIRTRAPATPPRLARDHGSASVSVEFYIDETGAVRLPSVAANQDPELAANAIAALHDWKFEPPTCKGKPVLVRVSQQFNFQPGRTSATAAAN